MSKKNSHKQEQNVPLELDGPVTPELLALLSEFSETEIETGVIERGSDEVERLESWSPEQIKHAVQEATLTRSLSDLIHQARENRSVSLAELGRRLGVTRGRAHQLEQPDANLEIQTLSRIADALGYDVVVTFKPQEEQGEGLSYLL